MGHDYCHREERLCTRSCPDCSSKSEADYAKARRASEDAIAAQNRSEADAD